MAFDKIGPEKVLQLYDPKTGMVGFVVIDNSIRGPGKGGIRMTPTVDLEEVKKLARAMTLKNSLAGLPFGGAKSGIIANPREISKEKKAELIKAFARMLKNICPDEYVAAPDISIAEHEIEIFVKEIGNLKAATGKPANVCGPKHSCGIPHELGSTGYGVYLATLQALKHLKKKPKDITFAVEGFGNVGTFAAMFLCEAGAKLVAVSDSSGCIYEPKGMDFDALLNTKHQTHKVTNFPGKVLKGEAIRTIKADVFIPAAGAQEIINSKNIAHVKFKLIVEGANIPITPEIEKRLHKKGVLVVPDFVANAGGVISSYVEFIGGKEKDVFPRIKRIINKNVSRVLKKAKRRKISPREAAAELALDGLKHRRKS